MNLIAANLIFEMLDKASPLALASHTLDLYEAVFIYICVCIYKTKISLVVQLFVTISVCK